MIHGEMLPPRLLPGRNGRPRPRVVAPGGQSCRGVESLQDPAGMCSTVVVLCVVVQVVKVMVCTCTVLDQKRRGIMCVCGCCSRTYKIDTRIEC